MQKAKEEAQLAREAAEAEKKASYQLGVKETQVRLAEELSEVCRDYCDMTWDKALIAAGVPADSILRLPKKAYYHPKIRKIPTTSSPPAFAPESSKQPLAILNALPLPEISKGSSQAGDQGQGLKGKKARAKKREKSPMPRQRKKRPKLRKLTQGQGCS